MVEFFTKSKPQIYVYLYVYLERALIHRSSDSFVVYTVLSHGMQLEVTCSSSQTYCWDLLIDDYSCIPSGTVCCGNGNYCPSGQVCTGSGGSTNTCESLSSAEKKCNPSWVPSRAYLFEECA